MARTELDLIEEAYNLGYAGKAMTEPLKRAAETDHAIFESWRAGRADRDDDGARIEPRSSAANSSSPSTSTSAASSRESKGSSSPGSSSRGASPPRRRAPVSRRRSAGGRAYRAARGVVAPVSTQVGHLLLLSLGLVALYLVLTSAGAVSGVVGGLQRLVNWVVSPAAAI